MCRWEEGPANGRVVRSEKAQKPKVDARHTRSHRGPRNPERAREETTPGRKRDGWTRGGGVPGEIGLTAQRPVRIQTVYT